MTTCAKLIDNDPECYPSALLWESKRGAEERALASVSGATSALGEVVLSTSAALLASELDRLAAQMSEPLLPPLHMPEFGYASTTIQGAGSGGFGGGDGFYKLGYCEYEQVVQPLP